VQDRPQDAGGEIAKRGVGDKCASSRRRSGTKDERIVDANIPRHEGIDDACR
jgi:hypothetical protein